MKQIRYIIIATLFLVISGCNKSEQPQTNDTEQQRTESTTPEENAKPTEDNNQETQASDQPKTENADNALPQNDGLEENPALDETTDTFPEIKTTVTHVEKPWGSIQRTTLHWYDDIEVFHEIPVFKEDSPAIKKINDVMMNVNQNFFTRSNLSGAWEYESEHHKHADAANDQYTFTYNAEVTEYSEKYISITLNMQWYMGGVNDYGSKNYTFDRSTGDPIQLKDFYKKSDDEIKKMVIDAVKSDVDDPTLIEWDLLNKKNEFSFYLKDGIPHVTFAKYEIAVGAAGAFDIPLK